MKILIDMNLSPEWVQTLSAVGIEAVHWSTIGEPTAPDREIMTWALNNNYVVFTNDLDFGTLLAMTQANSPSVIQVRTQDLLPDAIGELVINTLQEFEPQLEAGALLTIDRTKSRIRILPIGNQT